MANWLINACIIFIPSLTYVDQYRTIALTKNLGAFNPWICVVLILCNVLRSFFYVEKPFDIALLYQSYLMIPTQLLVLELCLRIERRIYKERLSDSLDEAEDFSPRVSSRETVLNRFHFLHCTLFLLLFITFFEILHLYLSPNKIYTEALGTLALGLEATLPMFQCYSNYKNKSTAGLSLILIFSWFVGDTSKIIYYLWIGSPLQFSLCGCIQLFVDLVIFGQMKWYKSYPSSVGFNPIPQRAHSF